ncbi:MAG: Uma2 family endonuclease [Chloroflexota bacterium]
MTKKSKQKSISPIKKQAKALSPDELLRQSIAKERPAWIPDHIVANWDPSPYAYQTEEDLMPGGGVHGDGMVEIGRMIKDPLREQGCFVLFDVFMMYRNEKGVRDRVAPDLLVVPIGEAQDLPSSYDSETQPTPLCAFEIVSPDGDRKDRNSMRIYIEKIGISHCVLIYLVDSDGNRLPEAKLGVWRKDPRTGRAMQVSPDVAGRYYLPQIQMWVGIKGQMIYFEDESTGEILRDTGLERKMREEAEKRADEERKQREKEQRRREEEQRRREEEQRRREEEQQLRFEAEEENARLMALLKQHGISV